MDGIHKLEPGHRLRLTRSASRSSSGIGSCGFNRMNSDLRRTPLRNCVQLRRIDPVSSRQRRPGGRVSQWRDRLQLRGGLHGRHVDVPHQDFSIGFREQEFDELPYARVREAISPCRRRRRLRIAWANLASKANATRKPPDRTGASIWPHRFKIVFSALRTKLSSCPSG